MIVPGSNILNKATQVIARQTLTWHRFTERVPNEAGQLVSKYAPAVVIRGSFQPVPRSHYMNLGLDFNKSYFNFYAPANILDIERDVSGDQLIFSGYRYQVQSATPWISIDGWIAVLCCQISKGDCPC